MIYDYADKVIRDMNKRNLRLFGKLKLLRLDELNIMQTVNRTYDSSAEMAKQRFRWIYEEAYEAAYLLAAGKEKEADEDLVNDWLLDMLEDYDAVTHYRFNEEAERKKARTAEALIATGVASREVDKALRFWTLQVSQYADRSVYDGRYQAFVDAGVKRVVWQTEEDARVCAECAELDGEIFNIGEVPDKPHFRCRCWLIPA